eukprot:53051-Eustigmatos_ZCMA.PRE.1
MVLCESLTSGSPHPSAYIGARTSCVAQNINNSGPGKFRTSSRSVIPSRSRARQDKGDALWKLERRLSLCCSSVWQKQTLHRAQRKDIWSPQ